MPDLSSPEVARALQELRDTILEGNAVAFVGAGASIPPGRTWQQLVDELGRRCGVTPHATESKEEVVDRCMEANEAECLNVLRAELRNFPVAMRSVLLTLFRLPFRAIITTNFDPWLRQNARREDVGHVWVYPHLPPRPYETLHAAGDSRGRIDMWYLHGAFDTREGREFIREIVFGRKSFEVAYGSTSLLPGFLLSLFTYDTVVFVGFNPTEPHVAAILRNSVETRRSISKRSMLPPSKRFWLLSPEDVLERLANPVQESEFQQELRALDITACWYDREAEDYRGLDRLLNEWVFRLSGPTAPPPFTDARTMSEESS